MFNQDHLLRSFIAQKAFLFKPPWFDWQLLQSIVKKSKQTGQRFRSSNYRSTTLREIRLPSHIGKARLLQSNVDTVERAVLACKLIGDDAMPGACLVLYEKNPSRDLWKASMLTWLDQVHSKCSGCFNHYYRNIHLTAPSRYGHSAMPVFHGGPQNARRIYTGTSYFTQTEASLQRRSSKYCVLPTSH